MLAAMVTNAEKSARTIPGLCALIVFALALHRIDATNAGPA